MAAQFKSSFIPKKTLSKTKQEDSSSTIGSVGGGNNNNTNGPSNNKDPKSNKSEDTNTSPAQALYLNLFLVIGIVIFLAAGLTALGLVGYRYFIASDIQEKSQALEAAQDEINQDQITRFERFDVKLQQAKIVLAEHEALTPFFDFLEANTIRSVGFDDFSYRINSGGHVVEMRGQAEDYMSLALQSDVVNQSNIVNSATFSEIELNRNGDVVFTMNAELNPSALSYDMSLAQPQAGPGAAPDVNETP